MRGTLPVCLACLKTSLEYIDLDTPFSFGNEEDCNSENVAFLSGSDPDEQNFLNTTYLDCFKECTRLDVGGRSNEPQSLCAACGLELRITYEFIKKAERSAKILKERSIYDESPPLEPTDNEDDVWQPNECEKSNDENSDCQVIKQEVTEYLHSDPLEYHLNDDELYGFKDAFEALAFLPSDESDSELADKSTRDPDNSAGSTADGIDGFYELEVNRTNDFEEDVEKDVEPSFLECSDYQENDFKSQKSDQERNFGAFKLNERAREQKRDFLCNKCPKTFLSLGALNTHLKWHEYKDANIQSDACEICGKRFSTNHNLRLHMKVHKSVRDSFECNHCGKVYMTKGALDNHKRFHEGHTVKCVCCSKEFSRQYELKVHMRFHTHEFPFSCEICGKKFAIKGHLRTHMLRHQGMKFQCEHCGKLFLTSKACQEHSFTHSEMPYPCSYCPKSYPSRQKYKTHLKHTHSVKSDDEEIQRIDRDVQRRPIQRRKPNLVQSDGPVRKVGGKCKE